MHSMSAEVLDGSRLSETELSALWAFRTTLFQLKPTVDPAVDRHHFVEVVRASRVARFTDGEGTLVGFWTQRVLRAQVGRRSAWVYSPDFGYLAAPYRGHPVFMRVLLRLMWPAILSALVRPTFLLGTGYPPSYMLACRRGLAMVADGHAPAGSLVGVVLAALREEMTGTIAPCPVATMNTIPEVPGSGWFARYGESTELRAYEAINPDWRAGYALYCGAQIKPGIVIGGLKAGILRALRNRPRISGRRPEPSRR